MPLLQVVDLEQLCVDRFFINPTQWRADAEFRRLSLWFFTKLSTEIVPNLGAGTPWVGGKTVRAGKPRKAVGDNSALGDGPRECHGVL